MFLELRCPANHADLLGWVSIIPIFPPLNLHLIHVPNFSEKKNIIVLTLIFPVLDNLRSTFKYNNSLNKATFKVDNLSLFFKNARAQEGTVISSKRLNIKGEIRLAKGRFGPGLLPYSCSPVLTVFIPNAS